MKISNIPQYVKIGWNEFLRRNYVMPRHIKKLKNKDFTVFSSNCNGAVMCHDLKVRFNSPTVNLSMSAEDFLNFAENLDYYLTADIIEKKNSKESYPVGILGNDITLHFMHYKTFDEAVNKWNVRKKRVNKKNMFFMMTDRDGCTEALIRRFEALPYKNKLLFSARKYPDCKSVIFCKEYEKSNCVPILTEWRNWHGERLYDRYFDFVGWLNKNL